MADPLSTYLHDHLAGAEFAISLLEDMRDENAGEPLGRFAAELLGEIEADRKVLQGLAERVGSSAAPLKDAAAWVGEKASRLKLSRASGAAGSFLELETLALGILGKLKLWKALESAADPRLAGAEFSHLAARAEAQHDPVEERRLQEARTVFRARTE
jgi:hypothetical protein